MLITNSFSYVLRNSNGVMQDLFNYISCSLGGYRTECIPSEEKVLDGDTVGVTLLIISDTLLALASWVNLFFIIQFADLKILFNKVIK